MKRLLSTLVFITIILFSVTAQKINQEKSKVEFEIGNLGLSSVEGTIGNMKGVVSFDKNDLPNSNFNVTVSPKSIDTDNHERDEHLKNEDFFDVSKYVTVRFQSSSIVKKGNGYIAKGKLTILETTKDIEIPFKVSTNGAATTFTGEIEVNRFDYGLASESYSGTFMVGKTAEIKITCVVE